MVAVVLSLIALSLSPTPLHVAAPARPTPACPARCGLVVSKFSPAYDTTIRYSAVDWAKNLKSLPRSLILQRIKGPLKFNLAVTVLICAIDTFFGPIPGLPSLPHTLCGSALGLLLVFRTNAAYDRFWEARKMWGVVTAECRAFASLACTFMSPRQALPMISLIAAFPVVMKNYLRGGTETAQKRDARRIKALLAAAEFEALSTVMNQPQFVLARLRQLAQSSSVAGVTEKEREILLKSAGVLGDCVSTCERIYNSPIPLAYSRHTSRFLVIYVSTLPLALVGSLSWATVPIMATICWALFGILEIGNLIEEPFTAFTGDATGEGRLAPLLPLTEVCRTIRRDVRAIAQYSQLAKDCGAPTIRRVPAMVKADGLPESFRELRQLFTNSTNTNSTNSSESTTATAFPKPRLESVRLI